MRTRFSFRQWHWTTGDENLFNLDRKALWWYTAFTNEAST